MSDVLVVIPARWGSSRLPGKPLIDIEGLPMVVRTWQNARKQSPKNAEVLVATDDGRISEVCDRHGVPVMFTSPDCRTGTDRVAEVAATLPGGDVVVNVQGDEPLMAPGVIQAIVEGVMRSGEVCCGMADIVNPADLSKPSVGKVVCDSMGYALYISRSLIPHGALVARTQVCVYGFPPRCLHRFAELPTSPLEAAEGIELLRWLEAGGALRMVPVPGERLAVDVPEDVEIVRAHVRKAAAQ